MENLRCEVYLEDGGILSRVDIYSHVKREWVYNGIIPTFDILGLLKDLMIRPDSTIIHLHDKNQLHQKFIEGKWATKYFNGLSGTYKLTDESVYEVFYQIPRAQKKDRELTGRCIKSITKTDKPINLDPENIERNLRHETWKKIA